MKDVKVCVVCIDLQILNHAVIPNEEVVLVHSKPSNFMLFIEEYFHLDHAFDKHLPICHLLLLLVRGMIPLIFASFKEEQGAFDFLTSIL
jgi:hypothetical protein